MVVSEEVCDNYKDTSISEEDRIPKSDEVDDFKHVIQKEYEKHKMNFKKYVSVSGWQKWFKN